MDDDAARPAPREDAPPRPDGDEQRPSRRRRSRGERFFAALTILGVALLAVGYAWYVLSVDGGTRAAALFAGALALLGGSMLAWSYFRPRDDFLDKLLSGAGQSVLLGAILSFGFAVTGQLAEDERSARADQRSAAAAIRADTGGKKFPLVDVRDQNLTGLDLREFDFAGANLSGTNLNGANLTAANLSLADLSDAIAFDADLSRAELVAARVIGADLRGADLSGADLSGADLTGADLSSRDRNIRALLGLPPDPDSNTVREAGANLTAANLNLADLTGADLTGADLTDANLTGANLTGAIEADLTDAKLSESTVCPDGSNPDQVGGVLTCTTG